MKVVRTEIVEYVEKNIIPFYASFDKAHREDHVMMVIEQSLKLAELMGGIDVDMVYVVAAFHDLGLTNGRENHHIDSRLILQSSDFVKRFFTDEQIRIMGEAVEDHRASNSHAPRSEYGLIVAEADRFIDSETIVRRTVQYSLFHYPELDRMGHFSRIVEHLNEKYGHGGYLKIWIPWSENAARLEKLRSIIYDKQRLQIMFDRIFDEELNERQNLQV